MTDTIFNAFWAGFEDPTNGACVLNAIPPYIDVVTLAFTGPAAGNQYSTNYLCKYYSPQIIQGWVRDLQARGQKVLLSIYDNPGNPWANVDIPKFVNNALPVLQEWGVDGIDIDGESGNATADDFIELVRCFREVLGPQKIITYDTFAYSNWDQQILNKTVDDVDWYNLMAYFRLYDPMIDLFKEYSSIVPPEKLTIGVKPGRGGSDQATRLPEVIQLSAYQPETGMKRGMMLYSTSIDIPYYTDHPDFTWSESIHKSLTSALKTKKELVK